MAFYSIKTKYKWIIYLSVILSLFLIVLILSTDALPIIKEKTPNLFAIQHSKKLLIAQKDKIINGRAFNLLINQTDLNALASAANTISKSWNLRADIVGNSVVSIISIKFLDQLVPRYFNVIGDADFSIRNHQLSLNLQSLQIGDLHVPKFILNTFNEIPYSKIKKYIPYRQILDPIQTLKINNEMIAVKAKIERKQAYSIIGAIQNESLLSNTDYKTVTRVFRDISMYFEKSHQNQMQLDQLVRYSFQQSKIYSVFKQEHTKTNIIAILAMGMFLGDKTIANITLPGRNLEKFYNRARKRSRQVKLFKRHDLSKHFVYSAIYTILLGSEITHALGTNKEIADFGTSGFSFSDLMVDRAGVAFANLITKNQVTGKIMQDNILAGFKLESIMPDPSSLPGALTKKEFNRKFSYVNSDRYQKLIQKLDARIQSKIKLIEGL